MKIEAISIKGFGKLRDIALDRIGPGVTCVFGLNEAGKTTLQNCISALLYGMKTPGLRQRRYEKEYDLFAPWDNACYEAALVYRLDGGDRFEVRRTFWRDEERATVWDANGRDVTSSFPLDTTRERTFAESQLGLTKNQFLDLCVFRQGQVEEMRQGEALARKLESLVDTTSEDRTARDAIGRMEQALDELGTPKTPTRPLARCIARFEQLSQELGRSQEKRRAVFDAAERRKALAQELAALRSKEQTTRLLLKEMELREARGAIATAEALDRDIAKLRGGMAPLERYREFPAEREQTLLVADSLRQNLEKRLQEVAKATEVAQTTIAQTRAELERWQDLDTVAEKEVERARESFAILENKRRVRLAEEQKRDELRAERATLERELEGFGPVREVLNQADWQAHLDACQPQPQEAETLDLLRTALLGLGEKLDALRRKRTYFVLLSWLLLGCAATLVAFYAFRSSKVALILLGLALAGFVLADLTQRTLRRRAQERKEALAEKLGEFEERERAAQERKRLWQGLLAMAGVSSANELQVLGHRFWEWQSKQKELALKLHLASQGIDSLTHEIAELEERLIPLLRLAGQQTAIPTSEQMDAFLSIWAERSATQHELISARQEHAERCEQERKLRQEMDTNLATISRALAQAGVKDVAEFQEACRQHHEHRRLATQLNTLTSQRAVALANRSLEQWQEATQGLDEDVASLRRSVSVTTAQLPAGNIELASLRGELTSLEEQIRRHELEVSRLEGIEESEMAGGREVVEIEEELEECARERDALLRRREALERARDLLVEISRNYHRQVAPKLNEICGELIRRVTGEYQEIRVEPMESDKQRFSINVRIPATQEFRPADVLSRGTIDQCYFVLKLGILSLLTANKERPPLLLDDTFAQYDRRRRREALRLLTEEVAARWQVVYFTCHRHHAEEICQLLPAPIEYSAGEFTLITSSPS